MAVSYCPNCQHTIAPDDDICEHCGAVLTASSSPSAIATSITSPPAHNGQQANNTCPHCQQPIQPGDDICEHCGAVIATIAIPRVVTPPVITTGPQSIAGPRTSCPSCQQPIQPGDDICENCGAVLASITVPSHGQAIATTSAPVTSTALTCPRCGNIRPAHVKFCNLCGYRYTDTSITLPPGVAPIGRGQSSSSDLIAGSILHGKYRVTSAIGAGGMGAVFLAEDQVLKRNVVIKSLLNENDAEQAAQSVKEREFLATIKHAGIVSIYDFITIGTRGYIVMEYVQGKTLDQIMEERDRTFDVPTAIRYILGILPAFVYLAKLDLVYCDFKPQNVMVEQLKDGSEVVKLIDMGTVIRHEPNPSDVYGTAGFYAREAVKHPSPQTDLYSICRTLAYMVTMMDLSQPIFGLPPQQEYQVFQEYPALYRLLAKGTHGKPERRFQSAEELAEQLQGVLRQAEGGQPGVPVTSTLFVSGMLTTTGKLGLRGQTTLDERDKAIDTLRHGDLALRAGSYDNAIDFYRQAQKINPKSIDARLRLAEAYIDTAEYSRAMAEISNIQRIAPLYWKIPWQMGRLLEAQENYEEAAKQYQELLNELPGELPPMQALARVYARQNKLRDAATLYAAILKADPGDTEASLGMANAFIALQQWDEAARALTGVSESAAKYVDAQLSLCDLYLNRIQPVTIQNIQHAIRALEGLANRTEDTRFYLMRAEAFYTAWQLLKKAPSPGQIILPGVASVTPRVLGTLAVQNYQQYLRRAHAPADREVVVRRKLAVSPWQLW
jgi:serine/threonine-protein kinase PknG